MLTDDQDDAPLAGLRIIEVSSFVAAPLGGMTLAQLGAEVIRIDPLGGAPDTTRWPLSPGGKSLYWAGLNKGKRSVTLDLRSAEGQRTVADLVARSGPDGGILLTNAGYPWLSYDALRDARPDLIHLRITGGHDGTPAVDYTVNAGIGFPLATGDEAPRARSTTCSPPGTWPAACTRPSASWPPSGTAAAPAPAAPSPSPSPTWRSPSPATSASWPKAGCRLAARGSGTTCTVVSRETSERVLVTPSSS